MVEKKAKTESSAPQTLRNMIFKFLRDKNGSKRGVMVGVCNDANYAIGVSCANINAGDAFDRKRGLEMAEGRAWKALELAGNAKKITERAIRLLKIKPSTSEGREISTLLVDIKVPGSVLKEVEKFKESAGRYFKGRTSVINIHGPWAQNSNDDVARLSMLFDERSTDKNRFVPPSLRQAMPSKLVEALMPQSFEKLANDLAIRVNNGEFANVTPAKLKGFKKNVKKVLSKKAKR